MANNNAININTISQQITNCVEKFFCKYNIDIYDVNQIRTIPHNLYNACMISCYKDLFKPDHKMINNQHSIIDYNDVELLSIIANTFIELAMMFNKSIGIMQFSLLTGIHWQTLAKWERDEQLNPLRSAIVKNIREYHKLEQIALLNDTPVGAMAVANNDVETGLNWSANQVQQITNNTVYYLPSERSNKLQLEKIPE
jgi:hypothetical protein